MCFLNCFPDRSLQNFGGFQHLWWQNCLKFSCICLDWFTEAHKSHLFKLKERRNARHFLFLSECPFNEHSSSLLWTNHLSSARGLWVSNFLTNQLLCFVPSSPSGACFMHLLFLLTSMLFFSLCRLPNRSSWAPYIKFSLLK